MFQINLYILSGHPDFHFPIISLGDSKALQFIIVLGEIDQIVTLFRMGFLGAAHEWGAKSPPPSKICHTYPTMMKLGSYTLPKEDPKNI